METERTRRELLGLGMRLVLLGVIALVLLVVSLLIYPLVTERTENANKAVASIAAPWGREQTIGGPMLVVPFEEITGRETTEGREITERREMVFMPDSLSITATVEPEVRARGIYRALLYRSEALVAGTFNRVLQAQFPNAKQIYWEEASLRYGVSDIVGLKNFVQCEAGDTVLILDKVTNKTSEQFSYPSALIAAVDSQLLREGFPFRMQVSLNGNETVRFCPMGRTTDVEMDLKWGNPSFVGRFLPDTREVGEDHTRARWRVLSINHRIPASFTIDEESMNESDCYYDYNKGRDDGSWVPDNEFAVKLLQPVSHYTQVDRAVKYAILLIVFTFLTIFFCDYFAKKSIPLFAYLLVGVAVLLFYTLLLSLSELVGFGWAYAVSTLAVIGLSTTYLHGFLSERLYTMIGGGVMVLLYGMMYILLTLENLPLLVGSIFLFVVLAVIMRLSLKMRW